MPDEIKAVVIPEVPAPRVFNKVDDPNATSMTSLGVYDEKVDELPVKALPIEGEEPEKVIEEKKEESKELEKKVEAVKVEPEKKAEPEKTPEQLATEKADAEKAKADKQKADDNRRFAAITKARKLAEHERDLLTEKVKKLEEKLAITEKKIPVPDEPKLEDFESETDYYKALTEWTYDKKQRETQAKEAEKEIAVTEKQAFTELDEEIDSAMDRGREKFADFNEVVLGDNDLFITPVMVEAALLSDIAEDIFYYLGQHKDEAQKIAEMTPLKIAREIVRLETDIKAHTPALSESQEEKKPEKVAPVVPEKKVSSAPEPITPPRSEGLTEKDPSKMNAREYRAWREHKQS